MGKALVIVESPAKAKTLTKLLGQEFDVQTVSTRSKPHSDTIYLAANPDREGEALCAKLAEKIGAGPRVYRVLLPAITAQAVHSAFRVPGFINPHLVESHWARLALTETVSARIGALIAGELRKPISIAWAEAAALLLEAPKRAGAPSLIEDAFATLRFCAVRTMDIAHRLYDRGWITYPDESVRPTATLEEAVPQLAKDEVKLLRLICNRRKELPQFEKEHLSEGTLVRALAQSKVGRPWTYASTVQIIQDRKLLAQRAGRLYPTALGEDVAAVLQESFDSIVDMAAEIERGLDEIAAGRLEWRAAVEAIQGKFKAEPTAPPRVAGTRLHTQAGKPDVPLTDTCPACGSRLAIKHGRFGEFTACRRYPSCGYVKQPTTSIGCPRCSEGRLVERTGRAGRIFYGCSQYPACGFTMSGRPVAESCPDCGSPILVQRRQRSDFLLCCPNVGCGFRKRGQSVHAAPSH